MSESWARSSGAQPGDDRDLLVAFAQRGRRGVPLMRGAEDAATSRLVTPARFARSGSTSQLDREALRAPVVAHALGARDRRGRRLDLLGERAQRRDVRRRRCGWRPGCPTGLPFSSCRTSTRAPAIVGVSASCSAATRLGGVVLVVHLDDDLGVVQLLLLGRDREPEARAAAADERGERLAGRRAACRPLPGALAVLVGHLADDRLDLVARVSRGRRERRVLGQPDVDVREVRQVLGEERVLQLPATATPRDERARSDATSDRPAMLDGPADDAVVELAEAARAALLDRRLRLLRARSR